MVRHLEGGGVNAYYAAYFEFFNRELFYEAHDVLEQIWLPIRKGPEGAFYKGLIQLAGAYVHLQKSRPGPSAALLKLARGNLKSFLPRHEKLDVRDVIIMIDDWLLEPRGLTAETAPKLHLMEE